MKCTRDYVKIKQNTRREEILELYWKIDGEIERKRKKIAGLNSQIERERLLDILNYMYQHYSLYNKQELENNKQLVMQIIASQFYFNDDEIYNAKELFKIIFDIAYDFFYSAKSEVIEEQKNGIKERYLLGENDITCYLVGRFGYGKTTLIKKIMDFPDNYPFPLVDGGRTTIHKAIYKLILKDIENHIYKTRIILKSYEEFKQTILIPQLYKALEEYVKFQLDNNVDKVAVINKFIKHDKANLDEIFGDVEEEINNTESLYNDIYRSIEKIYNENTKKYIKDNLSSLDRGEIYNSIKTTIINKTNSIIVEEFEEVISKIMNKSVQVVKNAICNSVSEEDIEWNNIEMISNGTTKVMFNANKEIEEVEFNLKMEELGDIYNYVKYFTENGNNFKGRIARIFIEEMYIEFPIREEVEGIMDESLKSIALVDTMGIAHTMTNEKKQKVASGMMELELEEADIVMVIDSAKDAMGEDTKRILKNLYSRINNEKIILAYSFYDYFLKKSLKSDKQREDELYKLQDKAIESFGDIDRSEESLKKWGEALKGKTIFLKGLKRYEVPKEDNDEGLKNSSNRRINFRTTGIEQEKPIDKILNAYELEEFNGVVCIEKLMALINKTYLDIRRKQKAIEEMDISIEYEKQGIAFLYNQVREIYLGVEHQIYVEMVPHHKQTEALTWNLFRGIGDFKSEKIRLAPVEDAFNIFLELISDFINSYVEIPSVNKMGDTVKQMIKEEYISKIKEKLKQEIVTAKKDTWLKLYNDEGNGVRDRRARNIYEVLDGLFYALNMSYNNRTSRGTFNWLVELEEMLIKIIQQYDNNGE